MGKGNYFCAGIISTLRRHVHKIPFWQSLHERCLRETDIFSKQRSGHCRRLGNINRSYKILEITDKNPNISTAVTAQQIGNFNHMEVHRTLKSQLLHPYHLQWVQVPFP